MTIRFTLTSSLLAFSLFACAGDEQPPAGETPPPAQQESQERNALIAADAIGNLAAFTTLATGVTQSSLTEGEVADHISGLLDALDDANCVQHGLVGESGITLTLGSCVLDGSELDGELDITVTDKLGSLAVELSGDLVIDGCGFRGDWTAVVGAGQISLAGDVDLYHGATEDLSIDFDATWEFGLGAYCPSIDLNLDVSAYGESISMAIANLDVCYGLCAAGVQVSLEGLDFSPATDSVVLGTGEGAFGFSCEGDELDFDFDTIPDDFDPPGGDPSDTEPTDDDPADTDPADDPVFDGSPSDGAWLYSDYQETQNGCGLVSEFGNGAGGFEIVNHDDGSFTITPGDATNAFDCFLSGSDFVCPNRLRDEVTTQFDAQLQAHASIDGNFSSSSEASGIQTMTVSCVGSQCAFAEGIFATSFPCTMAVSFIAIEDPLN